MTHEESDSDKLAYRLFIILLVSTCVFGTIVYFTI